MITTTVRRILLLKMDAAQSFADFFQDRNAVTPATPTGGHAAAGRYKNKAVAVATALG